jgi:hypothetical protein
MVYGQKIVIDDIFKLLKCYFYLMGLFDFFKKKKLSIKSANFAKLVKYFCSQSGIPVESQLKATKAIARDFIDKKGSLISNFILMDNDSAKKYLIKNGLSALDAEIFWSIIKNNSANFLQS